MITHNRLRLSLAAMPARKSVCCRH
jgi:hypothetical protein